MNASQLKQWAQSVGTSIEIAVEIERLSNSKRSMDEIWRDPTDVEKETILTRALSVADDDELYWGIYKITK